MSLQLLLRNRPTIGNQRPLRRLLSFKVSDFGTNRKPISYLILDINTDLQCKLHVSKLLQIIGQICALDTGVTSPHSFGVNP